MAALRWRSPSGGGCGDIHKFVLPFRVGAGLSRMLVSESQGLETAAQAHPSTAVRKMGGREANTLAVEAPPAVVSDGDPDNSVAAPKDSTGFDYAHLGPKGSAFFGKMVARELRNAVSAVRPCFRP